MSPAVYLELLQTRRGVWKLLLIIFGAAFVFRILFGKLGGPLALVILLPQAVGGIGLGTFMEELASGRMRFLFALPISRSRLWWVKLASGALGAAMMAAAVLAGIGIGSLLRPGGEGLEVLLQLLDLDRRAIVAGIAGYSLYTYCAGLFAILATRQPKLAPILNLALGYAPIALLVVVAFATGPPSLLTIGLALAAAALVLGGGSWLLYVRRNPFDESVGLLLPSLATLATAATVFLLGVLAGSRLAPSSFRAQPDQVLAVQASPQGGNTLVVVGSLLQSHGLILDDSGRIVADLGPEVRMLAPSGAVWSQTGQVAILREPMPGLLDTMAGDFEAESPSLIVWDPMNATHRELPVPTTSEEGSGSTTSLLGWTTDSGGVVVTSAVWGGDQTAFRTFVVNAETGSARELALPASGETAPRLLEDSGLLWGDPADTDGQNRLHRLDLVSGATSVVELPEGVESWLPAAADGPWLILERAVEEAGLHYRLDALDPSTGERRLLLGPPELPSATLEQAARRELGWTAITAVGPRWALVSVTSAPDASGGDDEARRWLVSRADGRVVPWASSAGTMAEGLSSSPSGHRLLASETTWDEATEAPAMEVRLFAFTPDGLQSLGEHALAATHVEWLDDARLLYLHAADSTSLLGTGQELWVLPVDGGHPYRFFEGDWAPSTNPTPASAPQSSAPRSSAPQPSAPRPG